MLIQTLVSRFLLALSVRIDTRPALGCPLPSKPHEHVREAAWLLRDAGFFIAAASIPRATPPSSALFSSRSSHRARAILRAMLNPSPVPPV